MHFLPLFLFYYFVAVKHTPEYKIFKCIEDCQARIWGI